MLDEIEYIKGFPSTWNSMIYVCNPYGKNIEDDSKATKEYCRFVVDKGYTPIAMNLLLPQFMDKVTEKREMIVFSSIALSKCTELWVFGEKKTRIMQHEISFAANKHIPVRYFKKIEPTGEIIQVGFKSNGSRLI